MRSPEAFGFSQPKNFTFIGTLYADSFKLRRVIRYRNSFLPIVSGNFKSIPQGTEIILKFQLHSFVLAFIIVWFSMVLVACIAISIGALANNEVPAAPALIPFGMLIFGTVLVNGGFIAEYKNTRNDMARLFKSIQE